MAILTFPTLASGTPVQFSSSLVPNTQIFTSPLNRTTQTAELPGARWQAEASWQNLPHSDARLLKAFLARLRGAAGRFYFWDMSHPAPSGTALGAGVVNGASQAGASIITNGWTINQANLFAVGDYIGIGGELKVVTVQAASDAAGASTITFEPPLRSAPANGSPIVIAAPTCVMRLADDKQDGFVFSGPLSASPKIACVEVF